MGYALLAGDQRLQISPSLVEFSAGRKMRAGKWGVEACKIGVPYPTNALAKSPTSGEPKKDSNYWLESPHEPDLPISIPVLVKYMRLLAEDTKYSLGRIADLQSGSERVGGKVRSCLEGILL